MTEERPFTVYVGHAAEDDKLDDVSSFCQDLAIRLGHPPAGGCAPAVDARVVPAARARAETDDGQLPAALTGAGAYLALHSPRFFASKQCLREQAAAAEKGIRSAPVLWSPGRFLQHVPGWSRHVYWQGLDVSKAQYESHGLHGIRQRSRARSQRPIPRRDYRRSYDELLASLADQLTKVVTGPTTTPADGFPVDAQVEDICQDVPRVNVLVAHAWCDPSSPDYTQLRDLVGKLETYLGFAGVDGKVRLWAAEVDVVDADHAAREGRLRRAWRDSDDSDVLMPLVSDRLLAKHDASLVWARFATDQVTDRATDLAGRFVSPVRWHQIHDLHDSRLLAPVRAALADQAAADLAAGKSDLGNVAVERQEECSAYDQVGLLGLGEPSDDTHVDAAMWRIAERFHHRFVRSPQGAVPADRPEATFARSLRFFEPRPSGRFETRSPVVLARLAVDATAAGATGNAFGPRSPVALKNVYGPLPKDWWPYARRPAARQDPVALARAILAESDRPSAGERPAELTEQDVKDFSDRVRNGVRVRTTLVVVVDPYLLGADSYRKLLFELLEKLREEPRPVNVRLVLPRDWYDGQLFGRVDASPLFTGVRQRLLEKRTGIHLPRDPDELERAFRLAMNGGSPATRHAPTGLL